MRMKKKERNFFKEISERSAFFFLFQASVGLLSAFDQAITYSRNKT